MVLVTLVAAVSILSFEIGLEAVRERGYGGRRGTEKVNHAPGWVQVSKTRRATLVLVFQKRYEGR